MTDHRQGYSPTTLYVTGCRMVDDYDIAAAVEDYMALHPDADEAAVRTEVEAVAAAGW